MTTARLPCAVPYCRRTVPRAGRFAAAADYICQKHWTVVPKALRVAHARAKKGARRERSEPAIEAAISAWDACKRYAIETAMGI